MNQNNGEVLLTQTSDPSKIVRIRKIFNFMNFSNKIFIQESLQRLAKNPEDLLEKRENFTLNIIDGGNKGEKGMEEEEEGDNDEGMESEEEQKQNFKASKAKGKGQPQGRGNLNEMANEENEERMEDENFQKEYDDQSDVSFDEGQDIELDK